MAMPDLEVESERSSTGDRPNRLAILKALGDNTRYAIYLELARSPMPLSTADIAETLDLHPNTVRPHLERMRDVGLLELRAEARGGVGRPQHLYSIAAGAPSLGLEPPSFPLLARLLLRIAGASGAGARGSDRRRPGPGQVRRHGMAGEDVLSRCADRGAGDPRFRPGRLPTMVTGRPSPSRTARSASWPRPALTSCADCTAGLVEGWVDGVGGGRVVAFRSLVDRVAVPGRSGAWSA